MRRSHLAMLAFILWALVNVAWAVYIWVEIRAQNVTGHRASAISIDFEYTFILEFLVWLAVGIALVVLWRTARRRERRS